MEASVSEEMTARPRSSRWRFYRRRLRRWATQVNLWPKLEWAFGLTAALALSIAIWLGNRGDELEPRHGLTILLVITLISVMGLATLVIRRVVLLVANRRRGLAGARLHLRLVGLFSLIAALPTLLVAVFASLLFEFGVQFWFSEPVRTVLDNADSISRAYVEENKLRIRGDILAMAWDLNREAARLRGNPPTFQYVVAGQTAVRGLSEAVVFTSQGNVLARSAQGAGRLTHRLLANDFERARKGDLLVFTGNEPADDRIQALVRLDAYPDSFLYVSRSVDPQVLAQVARAERALSGYRELQRQRSRHQLTFNGTLIVLSLLILVVTVLAALWLANRLAFPIGRLVSAAQRVGQGDLRARVPTRGGIDELTMLARAFNRMTGQLEVQTSDLIRANEQLDGRRRLIEAVMAGVGVGVLSVLPDGRIRLANRTADELMGDSSALAGRQMIDVSPELAGLVHDTRAAPDRMLERQLEYPPQSGRTIQVRALAEADASGARGRSGVIITIDDVTDQLANQRRAAWADIARRIAHEIKNPLTPIQLSAERLKRKYGHEVRTDPGVFTDCVDTIVRQVGDLRRMVDEFSSFARMPKPVFVPEPLEEMVRQSLLLQEMAHPETRFHLVFDSGPEQLVCDRRQITQALTNLLKNALEACQARTETREAGYQPEIWLNCTREGDELVLRVADNGIGLPQEQRGRLTEPYMTTRAKGTGLGLAIVRRIVEEHGGQLRFLDRDGGGACVEIHLDPAALSARTSEQKSAYGATGHNAATIQTAN